MCKACATSFKAMLNLKQEMTGKLKSEEWREKREKEKAKQMREIIKLAS